MKTAPVKANAVAELDGIRVTTVFAADAKLVGFSIYLASV